MGARAWCTADAQCHGLCGEQTSFLTFSLAIEPDLSNFDPAGAWPVVLDDFVMQAKAN